MSALELIALASSVSLLAGWRLYFVTLATGLAMKFGWIAMRDQLRALDVLASNWVIGIAAVGTLAEFFADKIAWVDSAWDSVHSFVRPLGGALLSLAIVDAGDPGFQVASFLLGGGAAFVAHAGKAGVRTMVNASPEPASNIAISLAEEALGEVDDSDGEVYGVLERLGEIHLKACRKAKPDPDISTRRRAMPGESTNRGCRPIRPATKIAT